MAAQTVGRPPLRFGLFEFRPDSRELRKDGVKLRLQDQPLDLLIALLERPGELVTRDELRARLWADGTYVEFNDGLNAAIGRLRQALGDSAENPRFVQTVPRHGYRFIAPVAADGLAPAEPPGEPAAVTSRPRPSLLTAVAAAAVVAAVVAWWSFRSDDAAEPPRVHRTTALTTAPGIEYQPSWSPDATRVAYASDQRGELDVWVRQIGTDAALAVTAEGADDSNPAWSPDGAWIAFATTRDGGGIDVVPALGGPPRRIARFPFTPSPDLLGSMPTLAWSPDGVALALAHGVEGRTGLYLVPSSGGEPAEVALPTKGFSVVQPSWSPDGRRIAYAVLTGTLRTPAQIWTVGRGGAAPIAVTDGGRQEVQPVWSADGTRIFFISDRAGALDVWSVAVDGDGRPLGEPAPVTAGVGVGSFALSHDGGRLAYAKVAERSNIWTLPLPSGQPLAWRDARPVTTENHTLEFLDLSSDGRRLVFDSNRGGGMDIWTMNADGTDLRRVTTDGADEWHPSLAPGGEEVAFHTLRDGNREIYVAPLSGGATRRLTEHPAKDWLPRWSPDGALIAFNSDRNGNQDVYVVPAAGGEARALTTEPANDHNPIWSPDGRHIAFASNREGTDEIYVMDRDGGPPRRVTRQGWEDVVPCLWSRADGMIYAWARGGGNPRGYWAVRPDDGRAALILEGGVAARQLGIAIATDGRRLLFPVWERLSDIWIADLAARGGD